MDVENIYNRDEDNIEETMEQEEVQDQVQEEVQDQYSNEIMIDDLDEVYNLGDYTRVSDQEDFVYVPIEEPELPVTKIDDFLAKYKETKRERETNQTRDEDTEYERIDSLNLIGTNQSSVYPTYTEYIRTQNNLNNTIQSQRQNNAQNLSLLGTTNDLEDLIKNVVINMFESDELYLDVNEEEEPTGYISAYLAVYRNLGYESILVQRTNIQINRRES